MIRNTGVAVDSQGRIMPWRQAARAMEPFTFFDPTSPRYGRSRSDVAPVRRCSRRCPPPVSKRQTSRRCSGREVASRDTFPACLVSTPAIVLPRQYSDTPRSFGSPPGSTV